MTSNLDYGVVGNCRTAALISKEGSIDWFCFPEFDSPSIFAKLLDKERGGSFDIVVSEEYTVTQKYLGHTNILSTFFESDEGGFEVIDFMPRYKTGYNNDGAHYMPPEIYRYIRLAYGIPRFRVKYDPRLNYAQGEMHHEIVGHDFIKSYSSSNLKNTVYLYSSLDLKSVHTGKEIKLKQDEYLLLSYNQKIIPIDQNRVYLEYQRTKVYWLNWSSRSKKFSNYGEIIYRSMLVLKLMSYRSGAVLAALTTSIPEAIGNVRNWDYRFCWLRDASMSIDTLLKTGHFGAAGRFMSFIQSIIQSKYDTFQIMYGIRGERVLTEETLDYFTGYENSRPVRIGNDAYHQKQNDSFGYLMDVIHQYFQFFPGTLDEVEDMWEIVKNIVSTVSASWENPDKGIWEIRKQEQHFVFSKVMCWVALDRAVRIADLIHKNYYAMLWRKEADKIQTDVFTKGWNEEIQSFTQAYGSTDMDSSLLLMEDYGFIAADDERYIKTVKAVQKSLFYKELMFRYKIADDFGTPSSAFTICTFWLVRALYVIGETEEARQLFNRLITYTNHLGLMSEDLDFESKRQLGNFPQAYSHLAMINTAILLSNEKPVSKFIRP